MRVWPLFRSYLTRILGLAGASKEIATWVRCVMTVVLGSNSPVYSQKVGLVTVEVYQCEGEYRLFIVGDNLASFLGSSESLDDCIQEIRSLQQLADSDLFKREIARFA